jgi:two-component system response regulator CpxR
MTELTVRLLIVEDDVKLGRLLTEYLSPLGYLVDVVHNGPDGLQRALRGSYDAMILDVMLPGMNGFDLLRELRKQSTIPVLMLTAMGDEPDRIAGLEVGADDYLPKTFSTRELLARLRAVLRRSYLTSRQGPELRDLPITIGDLSIDHPARKVTAGGRPLILTPIEYDILLSLARSAGRVKTREQLLLEVAERDFETFDRSIDVHVSSLRKKLGDDPKSPRYIETIRAAGYRMKKPEDD